MNRVIFNTSNTPRKLMIGAEGLAFRFVCPVKIWFRIRKIKIKASMSKSNIGNGNGLLFHMTQPISRSTINAIACSKPTISEH